MIRKVISFAVVVSLMSAMCMTVSAQQSEEKTPLYITFMLHCQQRTETEEEFRLNAKLLRMYADVFKKNGATITMHAEPRLATGCIQWKDNVLKEMEDKYGFPVGTYLHGLKDLMQAKKDVDATGVSNLHVNAHWTLDDWAGESIRCGFKYICGAIGMGDHGGVGLRDPLNHETVPLELSSRMSPWRPKSTKHWTIHDPKSPIVYIPGDSGAEMQKIYERYGPERKIYAQARDSVLTQDDFDQALTLLDTALEYVLPGRINTWYVCINLPIVKDLEEKMPLFDNWLKQINEKYVKTGKCEWKTMVQMLEMYEAWEKKQR